MNVTGKPWWQQATAVVSLGASGAITGFSFTHGAEQAAARPSPAEIRLLALQQVAKPARSSDAMLRSAIVNVAQYYLHLSASKTPAEMEALIWQHDSVDGADHGPSCAAFASLTLELGSQAIGQQSWVAGGSSYPWPLHDWADVRVDPNPASLAVVSVLQDAQAHDRWHPLGDGYRPQPGDWVLFNGHVEVVTRYAGGVLHTIGGDSLPDFSVNAHEYPGPLGAQGVTGFVNNGHSAGGSAGPSGAAGHGARANRATSRRAGVAAPQPSVAGDAGTVAAVGAAAVPGTSTPSPAPQAASARTGGSGQRAGTAVQAQEPARGQWHATHPRTSHRPARPVHAHPPGASPAGHGATGGATGGGATVAGGHDASGAATASVPGAAPGAVMLGPPTQFQKAAHGTAAIPGLPVAARHGETQHGGTHHAAPDHTGARSGGPAMHNSPQPQAQSAQAQSAQAQSAQAQMTTAQQAFIDEIAPGAMAAQHRYGVPASVTIAQAIDESGWGQSVLASKDHNLFGMKGAGPAGTDTQLTQEYENGQWVVTAAPFRAYQNAAQSIDDHGRLLATSDYYRQVMADSHNPDAFASALTGVYATDPSYGQTLIGLMRQYNLYQYDHAGPAAQASHSSATSTATRPARSRPSQPTATPGQASVPGLTPAPGTPGGGTTPSRGARPGASSPPRAGGPTPSSPPRETGPGASSPPRTTRPGSGSPPRTTRPAPGSPSASTRPTPSSPPDSTPRPGSGPTSASAPGSSLPGTQPVANWPSDGPGQATNAAMGGGQPGAVSATRAGRPSAGSRVSSGRPGGSAGSQSTGSAPGEAQLGSALIPGLSQTTPRGPGGTAQPGAPSSGAGPAGVARRAVPANGTTRRSPSADGRTRQRSGQPGDAWAGTAAPSNRPPAQRARSAGSAGSARYAAPAQPAGPGSPTGSARSTVPAQTVRPGSPTGSARSTVPAQTVRPGTSTGSARSAQPANSAPTGSPAGPARSAVPAQAGQPGSSAGSAGPAAPAQTTRPNGPGGTARPAPPARSSSAKPLKATLLANWTPTAGGTGADASAVPLSAASPAAGSSASASPAVGAQLEFASAGPSARADQVPADGFEAAPATTTADEPPADEIEAEWSPADWVPDWANEASLPASTTESGTWTQTATGSATEPASQTAAGTTTRAPADATTQAAADTTAQTPADATMQTEAGPPADVAGDRAGTRRVRAATGLRERLAAVRPSRSAVPATVALTGGGGRGRYERPLPRAVRNAFQAMAKGPLLRSEGLYRDVAGPTGLPWELLAACDWMQCEARPRHSPVHGEKLGTSNADGTVYWTRSAALEQCAEDLVELARKVYGIDLTAPGPLSIRELANAFAAFRWGELLKVHHTSAMEFPYSVAGLTVQHIGMRWPTINDPNAPDKPGSRFRMHFGAVPVLLSLDYPATL